MIFSVMRSPIVLRFRGRGIGGNDGFALLVATLHPGGYWGYKIHQL